MPLNSPRPAYPRVGSVRESICKLSGACHLQSHGRPAQERALEAGEQRKRPEAPGTCQRMPGSARERLGAPGKRPGSARERWKRLGALEAPGSTRERPGKRPGGASECPGAPGRASERPGSAREAPGSVGSAWERAGAPGSARERPGGARPGAPGSARRRSGAPGKRPGAPGNFRERPGGRFIDNQIVGQCFGGLKRAGHRRQTCRV